MLLASPYHEVRLSGLLLLVEKLKKAGPYEQEEIFNFYLKNSTGVNNWDLVDCSAPHIVGAYLTDRDRGVPASLVRSDSLWERRIAVTAISHFIR